VKWPWRAPTIIFQEMTLSASLANFRSLLPEFSGCDRGRSLQMFQVKKPTAKLETLFALQPFASIDFERNLDQ
jgi:hypothetical protein